MKSVPVFSHSSYKAVMRAMFRAPGQRGALSRAAKALDRQRSFLSQVMGTKTHLTPDLAFNLARHWGLSSAEREYFQTLVEFERAADSAYAAFLRGKLHDLRRAHESLSKRAERPAPSGAHDALYFSAWHWTAIHFLTSIPGLQTQAAIAAKLSLPPDVVAACLERLEGWGFVARSGERWEYKGGEFHLPKDSPLVILHHQNWRSRAVLEAQRASDDAVHFTNVHTISRADVPALKELLLKFIGESNELLRASKEEECAVLLCDLFVLK